MRHKELIEGIRMGCAFIEAEGYNFREIERNIIYEMNNSETGFCINFGWTEYDIMHISGLCVMKRFNIIETILQEVLGGQLNEYYTIYELASLDYIPEGLIYDQTQNNIHIQLRDNYDFEKFIEFMKFFYVNQVKGFIEKYNHLSFLNEQLQELFENKKVQSLLTDIGVNATIFRFYAIGMFCNNSFVDNFFEKTYFPYLHESQSSDIKKRELMVLLQLKKKLKGL